MTDHPRATDPSHDRAADGGTMPDRNDPSTGSYFSAEDIVISKIEAIRRRQRERWGLEHDKTHESWEWLGLIAEYAAAGRYADAAALCVAAKIAGKANHD